MAAIAPDARAETLREAACAGDADRVLALLSAGTNPNHQNPVNQWTALHWAAKRGHERVIRALLRHGADPALTNSKGEPPAAVAHERVRSLFGDPETLPEPGSSDLGVSFTPSYLAHPDFFYATPVTADGSHPPPAQHGDLQTELSLNY